MKVYIVIFKELIQKGGVLTEYPGDIGMPFEDVYGEYIKGVYSTKELAKKNCDYNEYIEEYEIKKEK